MNNFMFGFARPAGEEARGSSYGNYSKLRSKLAALLGALVVLVVAGCATPQTNWNPARLLELESLASAATVHFPAGTYALERSDRGGFYYRSPTGVIKHSFAGAQRYDGGLFVDRYNPQKIRGYIIWAGGWTKLGDFSRQPHSFIR